MAVLGSVDALVASGGIGEHAAHVRAAVCQDMQGLGIAVDPEANARAAGGEARIGDPSSHVEVLVIPSDEEGAIAADTYEIVAGGEAG